MSNPNVKPSDRAVLVGSIDPDAYAAAAYTTAYAHAGQFESLMALVMVGDIVATGLVDAKLVQATDSGGTGSKDISGKAITQLTAAGSDSDKQAIINCQSEDLDVANGFDYVALTVTLTTAGADMGAALFGFDARHGVGTDETSVDEIVG